MKENVFGPYKMDISQPEINSIVPENKDWTNESELKYWTEKEKNRLMINPKIRDFITEVFEDVSKSGIDKVISKESLKKLYGNIGLSQTFGRYQKVLLQGLKNLEYKLWKILQNLMKIYFTMNLV